MTSEVVQTIMASISELPQRLQHLQDPVILVASSGQESLPPVSRYGAVQHQHSASLSAGSSSNSWPPYHCV